MGFIFKIIQRVLVPLLFLAFFRSLFRDLTGRARGGSWRPNFGGGNPGRSYDTDSDTRRSPWDVLGLSRTASDAEIRSRYHELIAKYHPDKFAGLDDAEFSRLAAKKFREVQSAYQEIKRSRGF